MGRDHYQTACRYIRRMIKLGGKTKADKLIAQLRTLYAKRPALMQELDRFDGLENKFHYSEKCLYLQVEINGHG